MSKNNKQNNKIKKKKEKYLNDKENKFSEIEKVLWTVAVVSIIFIVFYLISVKITGGSIFKSDKDDEEVNFQYEEILAGRSFDMGDDYLVAYYDISNTSDEQTTDLNTSFTNFKSSHSDVDIYKCDLGNAFNKNLVSDKQPNTQPSSADELSFNGPTIIKFVNGKVEEFIYGFDQVKDYLDNYGSTE